MDDLSAIRRLKRGDIEALGVLVERYQVEAARAAYLITRDLSLADDATQEAFLRVYRHIRHFDEARPFAPYLMRIVTNTAIELARGHVQDDRTQSLDVEDIAERLPLRTDDPEYEAEAADLRDALWSALQGLTPEQRAAFVMRYAFDFSEREIAEALSAPQGTVSWRLHRARKRLRDALRWLWKPENPTFSNGKGEQREN